MLQPVFELDFIPQRPPLETHQRDLGLQPAGLLERVLVNCHQCHPPFPIECDGRLVVICCYQSFAITILSSRLNWLLCLANQREHSEHRVTQLVQGEHVVFPDLASAENPKIRRWRVKSRHRERQCCLCAGFRVHPQVLTKY